MKKNRPNLLKLELTPLYQISITKKGIIDIPGQPSSPETIVITPFLK